MTPIANEAASPVPDDSICEEHTTEQPGQGMENAETLEDFELRPLDASAGPTVRSVTGSQKARSNLKVAAIMLALSVSCIVTLHPVETQSNRRTAGFVPLGSGPNHRGHRDTHNICRITLRIRLCLDWRSLSSRQCGQFEHLGESVRHLGTKTDSLVGRGPVLFVVHCLWLGD